MKQNYQAATPNPQQGVINLYDRYAAMLLGYIFEIVKDRELAEQYMVRVFKSVADEFNEIYYADNTWCKLQLLAKNLLADFFNKVNDDCALGNMRLSSAQHTLTAGMTNEQRTVFCAIYYHGKSSAELASQLNQPELSIRKTLREAFAIVRRRS